jgi:hypothetical protein
MADRTTLKSTTPGAIPGTDLLDVNSGHLQRLMDVAKWNLTSVTGGANAVSAVVDPVLPANGLKSGMNFAITWTRDNTGAVTLTLPQQAPKPVVKADGTAIVAGDILTGLTTALYYDGSRFKVMGILGNESTALVKERRTYFANAVWNKPANTRQDQLIIIEAWGGGQSGSTDGGGDGGCYMRREFVASELPNSLAITIGVGGQYGGSDHVNGADTAIGTLVRAYGGGRKGNRDMGVFSGGIGARASAGANPAIPPTPATFGGGGGNGQFTSNNGQSQFGGNGGAYDQPGLVPGGGGGARANGAGGKVQIWVT